MTRFLHHTLLFASFPGSPSPSQDVRKHGCWSRHFQRERVGGARWNSMIVANVFIFLKALIILVNVDGTWILLAHLVYFFKGFHSHSRKPTLSPTTRYLHGTLAPGCTQKEGWKREYVDKKAASASAPRDTDGGRDTLSRLHKDYPHTSWIICEDFKGWRSQDKIFTVIAWNQTLRRWRCRCSISSGADYVSTKVAGLHDASSLLLRYKIEWKSQSGCGSEVGRCEGTVTCIDLHQSVSLIIFLLE